MKYHIHTAVVIGSGTMGAAIAAHLANAGVPVTLLDIVPQGAPADDKEVRNKLVNEGWDRCLKAKPANLITSRMISAPSPKPTGYVKRLWRISRSSRS
jgi:3-hydroxyacyl-CoA dehydrogenase